MWLRKQEKKQRPKQGKKLKEEEEEENVGIPPTTLGQDTSGGH